MSDYTIIAAPGTETWVWGVSNTGLFGESRTIADLEDDARREILKDCPPDHKYAGFSTDVVLERPYVPNGKPPAIVCDIDGTLALHHMRGPFDFDKVETDAPYEQVIYLLDLLRRDGQRIILLSGRQEEYREHTERWLKKFLVPYDELHMRAEGDRRADDLVKVELFNEHIRDRWHPHLVLDDRDRCVYLWRKLGLACWQVADGDF